MFKATEDARRSAPAPNLAPSLANSPALLLPPVAKRESDADGATNALDGEADSATRATATVAIVDASIILLWTEQWECGLFVLSKCSSLRERS